MFCPPWAGSSELGVLHCPGEGRAPAACGAHPPVPASWTTEQHPGVCPMVMVTALGHRAWPLPQGKQVGTAVLVPVLLPPFADI